MINSPFNNSCPTWPASPSQCPLCIYAYVYLCIYSMQEITTAGVQSFFFFFFLWLEGGCGGSVCIGLTLRGHKLPHLKSSKYLFNPRARSVGLLSNNPKNPHFCRAISYFCPPKALSEVVKQKLPVCFMFHFGIVSHMHHYSGPTTSAEVRSGNPSSSPEDT